MNYVFTNPDRVMVGTRGEVGARLFLWQVREGRRLLIMKVEKQQLSALAGWIGSVIDELGRPGHLPDDLALEPEFEPDFAVGDIDLTVNVDAQVILASITSFDDADTAEITLTKEWAGALAIAITGLVEAGRAPCPLCGGPLDPRGHDCPRTNGHKPPVR